MVRKIAVLVGTVPEAVKLGPVCRAFSSCPGLATHVLDSGQHADRTRKTLAVFGIRQVEGLGNEIQRDSLPTLASTLLSSRSKKLLQLGPDLVMVQGDTTTALTGALAAFYCGIPVAHVEAGLTTGNVARPYPEEFHREVIGKTAHLLFAPSRLAQRHAQRLARPGAQAFLTGNPCIDALRHCLRRVKSTRTAPRNGSPRKEILVTVHRRENHGVRGCEIGRAIAKLAATRSDARVLYVAHAHPALSSLTEEMRRVGRIRVLPPLGYRRWLQLLCRCHFVVSDSGGAQEEAPWLGKPVLVLREETERPEVVEAGAARLVGCDPKQVYDATVELLDDPVAYRRMRISHRRYPYGDGKAALRIVNRVRRWLHGQ